VVGAAGVVSIVVISPIIAKREGFLNFYTRVSSCFSIECVTLPR
jgi:hypothetical protein